MSTDVSSRLLVGMNVWNQLPLARLAYESFVSSVQQCREKVDFLVVDDCSPDGAVEQYFGALSARSQILYLRNAQNLGITKCWNIILSHAVEHCYDYVVQSNSDVLFPMYWVQRIVAHLNNGIDYVVPLSNNPGRYSPGKRMHPQDVRHLLPDWKELSTPGDTANETMRRIAPMSYPLRLDAASGFFIAFRTDFLKTIQVRSREYWLETPRHLSANGGVGGDESEIRKRTGVAPYLATNVYIHHLREYGKLGNSRTEFFKTMGRPGT